MAITSSPANLPFKSKPWKNTAIGTTFNTNIRLGPAVLHSIRCKETSGTGQCSTKVYDHRGNGLSAGAAVSHGFPVPSSGDITYHFVDGLPFSVGITVAGAKENGNALTTAPDASTAVTIVSK